MAKRSNHLELEQRVEDLEREIRERKQAETKLAEELRKFQGLYDLAIVMTTDQSLDANLQLIVDKSRELLRSHIAYIALQDETRGDFYKHTSSGIRTEAFRNVRLPLGKGLGGLVAKSRQGYIVEDYFAEKQLDRVVDEIVAHEGVVSGMAVPIQMGSRNLGVLYVFNRTKTLYSQADLDTLFLIGNLAAVEITRKQAEESLRESEERFRFMAETTGDVIYRLRYDSMNYDYLSPGFRKLTGYRAEEIQKLGFSKLIMRIDVPGQENVPADSIMGKRLAGLTGEYRADYLLHTKTGEHKWIRDHSFPWLDESARLVGSVGILSDITDYKRAEARIRERTDELIESEEKYRTLVENVPLVVYRLKPGGDILFVNHFVEELFGYGPVELLRNPQLWREKLYEEDRGRVEDLRELTYREGKELIAEYRVVHRDGHLVYVSDHAIPLRASDGRISSVDGIIIDVTGRIKLQEKLLRSEGLKTITEVSARLAHEIRNPLVSAGGFARRLLSSMSHDDPNRAKVEIIVKEMGRLEGILRMILNYIQPVELQMAQADPNDMVQSAVNAVQIEMREREVRLDLVLAAGLPQIFVDRQQMERVLRTLVKNALNQMPEGAILRISTSREKDMLQLLMRYPVLQLSPDDVEHFFYPFTTFRMRYDTVDLPMSKILVNKHGGTIDVRLQEPRLLAIDISLPLLAKTNVPPEPLFS